MYFAIKNYAQNLRPACFCFQIVDWFCMQYVVHNILFIEAINIYCSLFCIRFYTYAHISVASETRFSKQFCRIFQYFYLLLCIYWQWLTAQVKWISSSIVVWNSNSATWVQHISWHSTFHGSTLQILNEIRLVFHSPYCGADTTNCAIYIPTAHT
jgi:hypothetical protein